LWLWPGTREQKRRRTHTAMRLGFKLFHAIMHALRLYHRRSPVALPRFGGVPADQPCVLVANHPTLCDVTSVASLFPNVVAVARPSLANLAPLRWLVRGMGFVPVGTRMLETCQHRLRSGFDLLIFPEGTRSPFGGGLQQFHRGAFEIAGRAGVPIILLKLTCVPPALGKRLPIWKIADHQAVLTVEPFAVVTPSRDSRAQCREIERRYHQILGYSEPAALKEVT
jgi:1-acyl-sn-glycerol-3-phosphate acyltransferase